ncbi:hypothetical protein [Myxosarcina sp. GI1]|uniref:hypothetical protein n=1 Tax=Myxosarcina sp. GI1 TaxID=1541065 RepID=UPI0012E04FA1|nr:hypothetical protein [Myxosarcina sp. GI1]
MLYPLSVKADEFKGLVNVNPINNYLKDFSDSYNKVLAATNYIDRVDDDYEDAIMYELASIKVDNCLIAKRIKERKKCVKRLEYLGESLEKYLGL